MKDNEEKIEGNVKITVTQEDKRVQVDTEINGCTLIMLENAIKGLVSAYEDILEKQTKEENDVNETEASEG